MPEDPRSWCERYVGRNKVIHDSVWGTINLRDYEVAFIDTKLFQRLRFIHQTGAAFYIYPGAHHTRFEHSIGVLHQTNKMCIALRENGSRSEISEGLINTARMAALMHDLGHGPFSHTSEQYFSKYQEFDDFKAGEGQKYSDSGGGEVLSCLIATSDPVRKFLNEVHRVFKVQIEPDEVAGLISGTLNAGNRYKSEIIHGPFDADKLDYMNRDGHYSGLQVPIDLDRLYYSIKVETNADGEVYRLCGSAAAATPLMQIAFNKMILYSGVYHHHKVRTVDAMLWSIFEITEKKRTTVGGVSLDEPAQFLRITDDSLLAPSLCDDDEVRGLIEDIRGRRLWSRALVISKATVAEGSWNTENGTGAYYRLTNLCDNNREAIDERRRLSGLIALEAGVNPAKVWLDIPNPPKAGEATKMWIKTPGLDNPVTLDDIMPLQEWVHIYSNTRYTCHVFCPDEDKIGVSKAAKKVLGREMGLDFNSYAVSYAKITSE